MLDFQRALASVLMASIARGLGPRRGSAPCARARTKRYAPAAALRAGAAGFRPAGDDGDEPEDIGDGRRLIAGSHVDTGLLSLLGQDETGGLQMRGPDGRWREVPPAPDGLSVHCGDLVKALTGGRARRHAPPRRRPRCGSVLGRLLPGARLRDRGRGAGRRSARELRAAPGQRVSRPLRGATSGVRVMQGPALFPVAGGARAGDLRRRAGGAQAVGRGVPACHERTRPRPTRGSPACPRPASSLSCATPTRREPVIPLISRSTTALPSVISTHGAGRRRARSAPRSVPPA